ncbi:uncharacterized protein T551_01310 [Pneumocystis jirovecii RU7]|uniref:RAD50-interacting protein 1 n=1 Tax=Pneumocystis jirovecii (strain RU7) TaxID=1408657 RepID=A0A0W4ZS81_PNEJ7|nr:uncharacterized protein T551_01310 [Pneumocystis jirovecii RU7]KTW31238.1 hypothetical protein T551_01310 [Pneumocystis jirovecii RU7]
MDPVHIPGAWQYGWISKENISFEAEEQDKMQECSNIEEHLEEVNARLKALSNTDEIEQWIESLEKELEILEEEEKKTISETIYAKENIQEDRKKLERYRKAIEECIKEERKEGKIGEIFLEKEGEIGSKKDREEQRKTENQETAFFMRLYASIKLLWRLEDAKGCLTTLIGLEKRSDEVKKYLETDEKRALKVYQELIEWKNDTKKSYKGREQGLTHVEAFIRTKIHDLWGEMEKRLCRDFRGHLEKIGWPDKIKKGIVPDPNCFQRFRMSFQTLLTQHQEDKDKRIMCANVKHQDILLPFLIMSDPLNVQFRYHFMEKRKTNRIDKPEWFYTYILDTISSFADFFCIEIQNIINETTENDRNSLNEFITCLLKILEEKIQESLEFLLMDVHLFSHFVHETIKFDNVLEHDFGYFPHKSQWDGIVNIVLGKPETFTAWVELEKKFSIEQFQNIIDLTISPDAWNLDYDSVDESETKPTVSSLRIKNLIEGITEQYHSLKDFDQKSIFFTEIQSHILHSYYERLKSATDAFEVTFSRIIKAVSMTKTDEIIHGAKGLETLCRIYGSCIFIESCLFDWDDDIFFLELWQGFISNTKENKIVHRNTDLGNANILQEPNQGSLFSEVSSLYFNLHNRIEKLIIRHLEREIKEELRPYFKINTWSSSECPSSSMAMSCPVSIQMVDVLTLTDSMLNFLKKALSYLTFLRIYKQFSLNIENLLWNKVILKNTFSARGGTQFTRDIWELWTTCSKYVEKPEQNMKRLEDACTLLSLHSSNDNHIKSISSVGAIVFDLYKSPEEKTQYLKEIGVKCINIAETRNILQRRIDCWAQ